MNSHRRARQSINAGVAPVTYGQGSRPPRGDYSRARDDYTCAQGWERYTADEHALYCRLFHRQAEQLSGLACDEFVKAVRYLGSPVEIPRFETLNESLRRATGWEITAVPGLIPEEAFFALLSRRRFPVTYWIRRPEEFEYVVEPDVFHDLFGHVPLLFDRTFADYMQAYGAGGLKATSLGACEYLARLYWYTVEFGLIASPAGLRAYGAGLLSSGGELGYSIHNSGANHLPFDVVEIMRSRYRIDSFQSKYFVIDSFEQLFAATAPDFTPLYAKMALLDDISADECANDLR